MQAFEQANQTNQGNQSTRTPQNPWEAATQTPVQAMMNCHPSNQWPERPESRRERHVGHWGQGVVLSSDARPWERRGNCQWGRQRVGPNGEWVNKEKAAFIADVTIPDRSICAPAQALVKTWKMRNTGKNTWNNVYLHFLKGDRCLIPEESMKDADTRVAKAPDALAGQTADIHVRIRTPTQPGRYTAYFRLVNKDGNRFGPKIWVDLVVQTPVDDALRKAINASIETHEFSKTKQQEYIMNGQGYITHVKKSRCQEKRDHKMQKQARKSLVKQEKKAQRSLDGLQRKLARKQKRLEQRQAAQSEKLQSAQTQQDGQNTYKYCKYVNKLEKKLAATNGKAEKLAQKIEEAKARQVPAPVIVDTEPQCSIVPEQQMTVSQAVKNLSPHAQVDEQKAEPSAQPMPTEQPGAEVQVDSPPKYAFKYQTELEQVLGMGFNTSEDVVRYFLLENKGNVTKVINSLLSSMS